MRHISHKYHPNRKQSSALQYIHKQSNHPLSIIKQIPLITSKRLFDISSDKKHFDKTASAYIEALKNSGFKENTKFFTKNLYTS